MQVLNLIAYIPNCLWIFLLYIKFFILYRIPNCMLKFWKSHTLSSNPRSATGQMPILADMQLRSIQMISWHDFQISCWLILIRKILLLVSYHVLDILSLNIRVEHWMLKCLHAFCKHAYMLTNMINGFSSTQMGKGSWASFGVLSTCSCLCVLSAPLQKIICKNQYSSIATLSSATSCLCILKI